MRQLAAAERRENQCLRLRDRNISIRMSVYRDRWRAVALAQARNLADLHIALTHRAETLLEVRPQAIRAANVAISREAQGQRMARLEAALETNPVQPRTE